MIEIKDLYKSFGKTPVLTGVNLSVANKGIVAILGPNGSGKTTLIKSILGMVIPNKGSIKIDELSIKGQWEYRKQINYLPQIANFPGNLTVKELIRMIQDLRNSTTAEDGTLIDLLDLEPFLNKKLNHLSGGTKQKVNLVISMMFDSPILILDEPTTGLDPVSLIRLKKMLHEQAQAGKLILITSHIMSFVEEMADQIIFLLEGTICFQGGLQQLKDQTQQPDLERAIANLLMPNP